MIKISNTDFNNLNDLFKENYYAIKDIKEIEKTCLSCDKLMLKEIKRMHEENLLTIMKLLDEKERII